MKNPIELVLSSIHLGEARRVVTLGMDGKDYADQFLTQLRKHDRNLWDFIPDIQSAKAIRNAYFSAKQLEDTRITLAEPEP